jgi:hypothetical protein
MTNRTNFMIKYGSIKHLKDILDSNELNRAFTNPSPSHPAHRDQKHKLILDKLRNTNDSEYAHYRDKRMDPRIDAAEALPKGHKDRERTAYDVAGDRHSSMDHLKWAVMNGSMGTIKHAFDNRNAVKPKLASYLFTHTMNHPLGRMVRSFIRKNIPEGDLHYQMDKFEATLPPEQRSKTNP